MAVNDDNKPNIIKADALPIYEELLKPERTEAEQLAAAEGLWNLSFKCKDDIIKQGGCVNGSCLSFFCCCLCSIMAKNVKRRSPAL